MIGLGTIANVAAIIIGGSIGMLLKGGMKEHYQHYGESHSCRVQGGANTI